MNTDEKIDTLARWLTELTDFVADRHETWGEDWDRVTEARIEYEWLEDGR